MNWKKLLSVLALLVIVGLTIYFKEPANTTIAQAYGIYLNQNPPTP